MPRERSEQACFLVEIAHKKLAHAETFRRDSSNPHQKRARSAAPGQSRGFGVEKGPLLWRRAGDGQRRKQVRGQPGERSNVRTAVTAMVLVDFFRFEMAAEIGFDFSAAQPLLDMMERRTRSGGTGGDPLIAIRGRARHALAQPGELFL